MLHFNTSHVTVYLSADTDTEYNIGFQYISCYCLSDIFRCAMTRFCDFNTSHVTVYQDGNANRKQTSGFQYISCYCLSEGGDPGRRRVPISIHLMLLFIKEFCKYEKCEKRFQYISCYCLSDCCSLSLLFVWYFNTSHVTVYHGCSG